LFGVTPFISRRGLGAANGIVGSGSSAGEQLCWAFKLAAAVADLGVNLGWSALLVLTTQPALVNTSPTVCLISASF